MTQDPAAGENRKIEPGKKKCEITLTVSLGPKTMKMSDVKSLDYREATLLLKKMGLRVSTESITSDLYDVGQVIYIRGVEIFLKLVGEGSGNRA